MNPSESAGQCASHTYVVDTHQAISGVNGVVHAVIRFDLDGSGPAPASLIAGGEFSVAGQVAAANVAAFDGSAWRSLNSGLNGRVSCLAVHDDQLYAGGEFTSVSGTASGPVHRVARWDGAQWQPLGMGVSGGSQPRVQAMQSYGGRLFVGGQFAAAGSSAANNIAAWDGAAWNAIGSEGAQSGGGVEHPTLEGDIGEVHDLSVFENALVVAGRFSVVDGSTAVGQSLALFDGASWTGHVAVGPAGAGEIRAVEVHTGPASSTLYAAGDFSSVNGVPASNIANFSRASIPAGAWTPVGPTGLEQAVSSLALITSGGSVTNVYVAAKPRSTPSTLPQGVFSFASASWSHTAPELATFLAADGGLIGGVSGISRLAGQQWLGVGPGLNGSPRVLWDDYQGLTAFGGFTASSVERLTPGGVLNVHGWFPVSALPAPYPTIVDVARTRNVPGFMIVEDSAGVRRLLRRLGDDWSTSPPTITSPVRFCTSGTSLFVIGNRIGRAGTSSFAVLPSSLPPGGAVDVVDLRGEPHAVAPGGVYSMETSLLIAPNRPGLTSTCGEVWNNRLFIGCVGSDGQGSIDELVNGQFVPSLPGVVPSGDFVRWNSQLAVVADGFVRVFNGSEWTTIPIPISSTARPITHNYDLLIPGTNIINGQASPLYTRIRGCRADFDRDCRVSIDDVFNFLTAYFQGCRGQAGPPCDERDFDMDGSNFGTIDDVFVFLNLWFAGC